MKKITYSFWFLGISLIVAGGISAQTSPTTVTNDAIAPTNSATRIDKLQELRNTRKNISEKKMEIRDVMEDKRDEMKDKRMEFKDKIQAIKDEKKRALVERIDDKISIHNANHTTRLNNVLEKLGVVLDRITERAQKQKLKGLGTAMVESAIASANTAIEDAKAAVSAQAAKIYTANITTESTLKLKIGPIVSQFRKDMSAVHKLVVDAKQAVQKADSELNKVRNEGEVKTGGENGSTGIAPLAPGTEK